MVIANELLDNLPTRLLERTLETWKEVGVDEDLTEVLLPTTLAPAIGDDVVPGSRIALAGGRRTLASRRRSRWRHEWSRSTT